MKKKDLHLYGCLLACILLCAATSPSKTAAYEDAVADAKSQMFANPARAYASAKSAQEIAEQSPENADQQGNIATTEWLQGEALVRTNQIDRAAPLIERALVRLGRSKPTLLYGDLIRARAGVNESRGDVSSALFDYQRGYNIYKNIGNERSQSLAMVSIGALYQTADDNKSALKYYSRALDIYHADPTLSLSIYNNRGIALKALGMLTKAERQFNLALSMARSLKSASLEGQILRNLARLAVARNQLSTALKMVERGRAVAASNEAQAQFDAIEAEIAFRRGSKRDARALIDRSFASTDVGKTDLSFREAHYTAYEIYRQLGDEHRALAHLQAMKRLDDQVWKLTASTNTALMAARFDSANQEARIARLKADAAARQLAMAQAETRFQQIIFGGIALGALVMLGLLGFGLWQSRRARIRLSASNAALERALAAKTEFLATTSHEIRTPLNGILGMTQVMLADAALDASSRDRVGIVHDAGLTMRSLVDDILDVAKMETGNLTVEAAPFDLRAMLEDVTRMWGEQARAKGLQFRLELKDCPRGIVGDAGRVRQMIYNLLSNAVKFTATGHVTLTVVCDDDRLSLSVADTGIGIAPEHHQAIFESFRQADGGTTRQFGGTGLGLAIVRNIAAAMGGSVTVASAAGEGATFTVNLPFVPAEIATSEVNTAGGLLIVDKNPIARAMLKAVLEPRAGTVVFASSCVEAVEKLAGSGIVRVVLDEATARDGADDPFTAVTKIVAVAAGPVAILWTAPDELTRARLLETGAAQVISKPIAGPALASALYACNTGATLITQAA